MQIPGLLLLAAVPVASGLAVLMLEGSPGAAAALPLAAWWRMAADALLANAAIAMLLGPLCGVAIATRDVRGDAPPRLGDLRHALARLAAAAALFAGASAVVTATGFGLSVDGLLRTATANVTLGAGALAAAAVGACAAWRLRDPLDAVAVSTLAVAAASMGVLVAGPLVEDLSHASTNAALLASPLIATAAAAGIDVLRTDLLYQLSPLAHRRFDYPSWQAASGLYLAWAALCFLTMSFRVAGSKG
jgi:hypothetical protein